MIRFVPVEEAQEALPIAIGLSGASGTGKTYTALRIARGIAHAITGSDDPRVARIGFVDTENRRGLHYRDTFPEMAHFDMQALGDGKPDELEGFTPERWIKVLDQAEAAKLPVVVLDSFSHAWEGVNGVLDLQAKLLDRMTKGDAGRKESMNLLAWAQIKPRYRRLIERIIRSRVPIIVCTRAKAVIQDPKTGKALKKTKTRSATIPWDPASDADLIFEMGAQIMLDPSAPGAPVWPVKLPDQLRGLFPKDRPMDEELGRELVLWSRGQGRGAEEKKILDAARDAARKGTVALQEHWRGLPRSDDGPHRALVKGILESLQELARDADRVDDDDLPMGTSDPAPTDDEIARRTAEREIQERDRAAQEG